MFDLEAFRAIVETVSFHRLIGLKLERADAESGIAVLRQPYDRKLSLSPHADIYHGGVIAALIDVAGSVACGLRLGRPLPTVNFRVDFLRPAAKVDLIATGRLVRSGKSVSVADVEISDDDRVIYAIGRGTFSTTAGSKATDADAG